MPTLTKREYADYQRLKELERSGHVLSRDCLRLIIRSCEGKPEAVGKHFIEVYYRWKRNGF